MIGAKVRCNRWRKYEYLTVNYVGEDQFFGTHTTKKVESLWSVDKPEGHNDSWEFYQGDELAAEKEFLSCMAKLLEFRHRLNLFEDELSNLNILVKGQ